VSSWQPCRITSTTPPCPASHWFLRQTLLTLSPLVPPIRQGEVQVLETVTASPTLEPAMTFSLLLYIAVSPWVTFCHLFHSYMVLKVTVCLLCYIISGVKAKLGVVSMRDQWLLVGSGKYQASKSVKEWTSNLMDKSVPFLLFSSSFFLKAQESISNTKIHFMAFLDSNSSIHLGWWIWSKYTIRMDENVPMKHIILCN
jgi:hypothetical protein